MADNNKLSCNKLLLWNSLKVEGCLKSRMGYTIQYTYRHSNGYHCFNFNSDPPHFPRSGKSHNKEG